MPVTGFDLFKDQCAGELEVLQEGFIKQYNLNSYQNWSFDDDYGIFHFYSDDGRKNLYFKYALAGSYSSNTSSWKWAWDNERLKASECRHISKVKQYGEQKDWPLLTTGLVEGDLQIAWDMIAITASVLSAIGIYNFKQEHLTYFIIFTATLTKAEYNKLKKQAVLCDTHGGASRAAYVCQHLNKDTYTGFHEAFESNPLIEPDDDDQAWCDRCEKERLKEGEWNARSEKFAKIRLICDQCFFEIKRRNTTAPEKA